MTSLIKLSLPIMGTAFIQMLYSLIDMMWLGKLGTESVAAVGTSGFINWFGMGLTSIAFTGAGVNMAQAYGKGDVIKFQKFLQAGIRIAGIIGMFFSVTVAVLRSSIISFFNIESMNVVIMAKEYLLITGSMFFVNFLNPVMGAVYNSKGNSFTPFVINTLGLVVNIILDPLLIFGIWNIGGLGVKGAAYATAFSRITVFILFLIIGCVNRAEYVNLKWLKRIELSIYTSVLKVGVPSFAHTAVMSTVGMQLTRIINAYGSSPVAVYSIGSQVESISWMTTEGFASAISTFIGQNYGAEKYDRVISCYKKGMCVVLSIGLLATVLLVSFSETIFRIFSSDANVVELGVTYLTVMGMCQFFFSLEIGISGCFSGLGLTVIPAFVSTVFNLMRIPFALYFTNDYGPTGVWMAMALSGVLKGIISFMLFKIIMIKTDEFKNLDKYWRRAV